MGSYLLYKYVLRLLTPTLVVARRGSRGMVYTAGPPYIPGSQVRGGLLTYMLREGIVDPEGIRREALWPRHSVTPALPSRRFEDSLYRDADFSHILCYTYKSEAGEGGARVYCLSPGEILTRDGVSVEKLQEKLAEQEGSALRSGDHERRLLEREPYAGPVVVGDEGLFRADVEKNVYVEVGLERSRGGAKPGALYAYEYFAPGQLFTGYLACTPDSPLCVFLQKMGGGRIAFSVGKGVGRGFGLAEFSAEPVEPLEDEGVDAGGPVVLKVIGPTFTLDLGGSALTRPPRLGDRLVAREWLLPSGRGLEMEVVEVLGPTTTYTGWSYRTGSPKLPVNALQPGSLVVVRVVGGDEGLFRDMKYIGLNRFASQGFNIVRVVSGEW